MHIFAIKVAARTETLFWIKEQEELYRREKRKRRIVKPRRRARRAIHAMRVPTRSRATSSCLAIGFLSFAQGTTSSPSRRLPTCTYIYRRDDGSGIGKRFAHIMHRGTPCFPRAHTHELISSALRRLLK